MKKIIVLLMVLFFVIPNSMYSQTKSQKTGKESAVKQTSRKNSKAVANVATTASTDKVVSGQKGPEGQTVYVGSKGGDYYINKSGKKTYMKTAVSSTSSTKGSEAKPVKTITKTGTAKGSTTKTKSQKSESKSLAAKESTDMYTTIKPESKNVARKEESNSLSKGTDKPGQGDKILNGRQGPEGQPVYLGPRGGEYYINKNGNKTYLKSDKK